MAKKFGQTQDHVKVNILGPKIQTLEEMMFDNDYATNDSYRSEEWTIGVDISREQYTKFIDKKTKQLYIIVFYKDGKPCKFFLNREKWLEAYDEYKKIDNETKMLESLLLGKREDINNIN